MPGAYTHLTMVNEASERPFMQACDVPRAAIRACAKYLGYCELGVVSPDLPYLKMPPADEQAAWADAMHYQKTDEVIRRVIDELQQQPDDSPSKQKGLAWLLGYTAHVVMDCTLHPVVNLRVGPYAANQKAHRTCEMNQDVYIFDRLNLSVRYAEHMDSGIGRCVVNGVFDPVIDQLWTNALRATYPIKFASTPPVPADWHKWFTRVVSTVGSGTSLLVAIARHVVPSAEGLIYPTFDKLDYSFIKDLRTPTGDAMHFDAIFDKAKRHVGETWRIVARGALGLDREYEAALQNCNLDTGENAAGRLVYWGE